MSNPCIECGKERIEGKTWKEKVGTSVLIYTQTVCPDKECQKIVDKEIALRKEKFENMAKKKLKVKTEKEVVVAVS